MILDNALYDDQEYPDPQIAVRFRLVGEDVDLNEVSEILDLVPIRIKTPCDWPEVIKNPKIELPDSFKPSYLWEYSIPYKICTDVSVRFEEILSILKGKEITVNKLKERYPLEVSFEVGIQAHHYPSNMPAMILTQEIITFISSLGASIGFSMCLD